MWRVPAFVSRAFRHTSIYVRTDRIKKPEDLKGRKVGVPEYQLTANVWARAMLEDDYGVKRSDIHWIRGGIEEPGRPEKITVKLPPGVRLDNAPEGATISALLEKRRDRRLHRAAAAVADRERPSAYRLAVPRSGSPRPRIISSAPECSRSCMWSASAANLADKHPWLPGAVFKAFEQSKAAALKKLIGHLGHQGDAALRRRAAERGARPDGPRLLVLWRRAEPQGAGNFLRHHHAEGLSPRRLRSTNCFIRRPYETFKL